MNPSENEKNRWAKRVLWIILALILLLITAVSLYSWLDKSNGEIVSSGNRREYLLYVPDSYEPSAPAPLVISLHGFAEWPAHIMRITRWDEAADEYGFILVFPSGTGFPKRWSTRAQGFLGGEPDEEVLFISDLIDKLTGEYNIDTGRIYVNGFSNGGGMSFLLACNLADKVTAIGGVASSDYFPRENCTPSRPVPVIAFHGTKDPLVPYYSRLGDPQISQNPGVPYNIEQWAKRNECELSPVDIPSNGEVSGIYYTNCEQNAEVYLYTIYDGGHTWPGGEHMPGFVVGHSTNDIDATTSMWNFFSRYSLQP
jgi:polyhydroxybutyrate depolymerase